MSIAKLCNLEIDILVQAHACTWPEGQAWDAVRLYPTTSNLGKINQVIATTTHSILDQTCALYAQISCATATWSLDAWHLDYGLPDECGGLDLCTKKRGAIPLTRAEMKQWARDIGYVIDIQEAMPTPLIAGEGSTHCQGAGGESFEIHGADLGFISAYEGQDEPRFGASTGECPTTECGGCHIAGYHCEIEPVETQTFSCESANSLIKQNNLPPLIIQETCTPAIAGCTKVIAQIRGCAPCLQISVDWAGTKELGIRSFGPQGAGEQCAGEAPCFLDLEGLLCAFEKFLPAHLCWKIVE